MFMGFQSPSGRASTYAEARKLLDAAMLTPTGHKRTPSTYGYPLGGARKPGSRMIRERSDGAIVMRLYNTDVVTWESETAFSFDSWASKTTGEFASALTPVSVGADCTITYHTVPQPTSGGDYDRDSWRAYWRAARVCHGDVRFQLVDGFWLPDEDTCAPFHTVKLDRAGARRVSKSHHLVEFETWLSMAPRHLRIEHDREDNGVVAEALLARDWRTAAEHLPLIRETRSFGIELAPLPIATRGRGFVTPSSLTRFRAWLYDAEDLFERTAVRTLSNGEYTAQLKRVRALDKAGVYVRTGWGW